MRPSSRQHGGTTPSKTERKARTKDKTTVQYGRLSSSLSEVRGGLDRTVALDNTASQPEEGVARGTPAPGEAPVRPSEAAPEQNDRVPEGRRGPRARRHANHAVGRSHVHLMRVGCVLGTCQVQNLSHRLHQLIGRRGREDSSPINPRSPHSYG
ncbi:unnamed protein product [Boreogadus saida]